MELPWLVKLRIALALALGIILIGILAWPLAAPPAPFGVVSIVINSISLGNAITLALLAVFVSVIAYFLTWPYGREIGVLAVPAGLAVWALRSSTVATLIQQNPTAAQRYELFSALKYESFFWLIIIAFGFGGVWLSSLITAKRPQSPQAQKKPNPIKNVYLRAVVALVASVLIAQLCISVFAQDVKGLDSRLGSVVAQPAVGQIAFAVFVSFGIAAFAVKKLLDIGYICPVAASAFVTFFVINAYATKNILQYLAERCPAVFFYSTATAVLPVQMVAFGVLGSITGYWLAVRYDYWRAHA